jgi:hypothetical protein
MADSFTPELNLVKPEIDQSAETWGQKLNSDLDILDTHAATVNAFMAAAQGKLDAAIAAAILNAVPPKTIIAWYGTVATIPAGWHLCDGNGGTPNLGDRFILGTSGVRPVGETGGSDHWSGPSASGGAHDHGGLVNGTALSELQMPTHRHGGGTDAQGDHGHNFPGGEFLGSQAGGGVGGSTGGYGLSPNTTGNGVHSHNVVTDYQGGGQAHQHGVPVASEHVHTVNVPIVPAYVALLYIMRL